MTFLSRFLDEMLCLFGHWMYKQQTGWKMDRDGTHKVIFCTKCGKERKD
jgi:hypothetical protein